MPTKQTDAGGTAPERPYPHMCRDGHPQIGFSTDEELCPVCLERNRAEQAEATVAALIDVLDEHCRGFMDRQTTPANLVELIRAMCKTDERHVHEKQEATKQVAALRSALEQVEWVYGSSPDDWAQCPWCSAGGWGGGTEHYPHCKRQAALAAALPPPQETE